MQQLSYATRSRFLPELKRTLNAQPEGPWTVQFVEGREGYGGSVEISLPGETPGTFGTDWMGRDPTRFSARLRAAATALHECGCEGRFRLTHEAGKLQIEPI